MDMQRGRPRGYAEGVCGESTWRGYVEGVCGGGMWRGMQRRYAEGVHRVLPLATIDLVGIIGNSKV